ncbi:MAG: hypothetical protein KA198_01615 [Chitinophagaceae bacterium]|nr:hypothetical protein [Chitinophagaceae bacterium]
MRPILSKLSHVNLFLNSIKGLFIGFGILVAIVSLLYVRSRQVNFTKHIQSREDASGFEFEYAKQFIYFYYYTGYFPLATQQQQLNYSKQAATNEIKYHGDQLIMEYKHWSRLGEHARIFAFLPNAWVNGSPEKPSLNLFNALMFTLGLLVLFRGTWKIKYPLLGLLACLLILSTPYYHYEIFTNQNIFGLLHSTFFFVLGIMLPFFFNPKQSLIRLLLSCLLAVCLISFHSEIRNEISIVILSLLLVVTFIPSYNLIQKITCLGIIFLSFWGTKKSIQTWFDHKFEHATTIVKSAGGHVYTGGRIAGHQIWHNVFCGLGDFDTKYNHAWDDRTGYKHALPILKNNYHIEVPYSGGYQTDLFYDSAKLYYIKFDEILPYESIMKNEVLRSIQHDPLWYGQILLKRCWILLKTTLPFPNAGWLIFPLMVFLWYKKEWTSLKIILVCLPLSAVSLLIYSGRGATYNSIYPYAVLIISMAMLYKYLHKVFVTSE